jgi:eukaryotic-like serine/threonine-protein kinase
MLDALEYLHSQTPPIIHRDIKPQNIQLTPDGRIFLLDFGLSKSGNTSKPGWTPGFAPREQISGEGTDVRTDIYSMGATLYYLFTGVFPPASDVRQAALDSKNPDPLMRASSLNPDLSQYIVRH